nr:MAG TPA: hypothetical protein [Caudoviricetes sp.]
MAEYFSFFFHCFHSYSSISIFYFPIVIFFRCSYNLYTGSRQS